MRLADHFGFAVEYHHHGGQCWLRRHKLRDPEWYHSRWWVGRDVVRALAYGQFRYYVDVIRERRAVEYDPTGELICNVFDGVRLVEFIDGRTVEIARWLNPTARANVTRA